MYDLNKPITINWELNNICNLMCPQCARNTIKDGILQWKVDGTGNPGSTLNDIDTSLETFKIAFNNIGNVDIVRFIGTISENVASKDFAEICNFIIDSGSHVTVSTNGSLRSKKWWADLGKIFNKDNKSFITFCLDGLRDELSLYRIGADYNKIIENARAYISTGGSASWKMLVFKHNQHQIEEAKSLAKEYNFDHFTLIYSNRTHYLNEPFSYKGKDYNLLPQDIFPEGNEKLKKQNKYVSGDELGEISCKFQIKNKIYVDHTNRVWPCCYLPNKKNVQKLFGSQKFYDDYYYDKSNNLLEKTLSEILYDNFYETLQMSWTEKSAVLDVCKSTCTVTHNSGNTIRVLW
jgi:MoaA/NifB/PqqE/SkfB family radical SAM enzyme